MPAAQRNKLFQPTFAFPMISVGILLVVFLIYYFPVTARQEASLNSRAFRSLAAVSDGLQSRVVTYLGVFEQAGKKDNPEFRGSEKEKQESGSKKTFAHKRKKAGARGRLPPSYTVNNIALAQTECFVDPVSY